jgi:hypothetical protein
MTTDELRHATEQFDQEFVADEAKPLSLAMRDRWRRAKTKSAAAKKWFEPANPRRPVNRLGEKET